MKIINLIFLFAIIFSIAHMISIKQQTTKTEVKKDTVIKAPPVLPPKNCKLVCFFWKCHQKC